MKISLSQGYVITFIVLLTIMATPVTALGTTEVTLQRYANDRVSLLNETTVSYQWMMANLPVLGDGITHYYSQGPTFNNSDYWDNAEWQNIESRDWGAVKGTDLKELCDLVGGMHTGETADIVGSDGFRRTFSYESIYIPNPRQGPIGITWFKEGLYPESGYDEGMRLIMFADAKVNTYGWNTSGWHVFGNADMRNSWPPGYWYNYSGTWPSSGGTSVKIVRYVDIYSQEPVPPPVANFTATPTQGMAPLTVVFTDLSTNAPTGWSWTFGDGNATNKTVKNPIHTYLTPGHYTVSLNVSNPAGSNISTRNRYINVTNGISTTGVYRPGAGFYLKMDNGGTWNPTTDVYLGWDNAVNDLPVAGDWNSDGRTETGVYRPGAGFYLKMDNGGTWNPTTDVYLGWDNAVNDLPVAGDWNSDGRTETGEYRPGAGFYLKMDNGGTWNPTTDVYLGWDNAVNDLPVAGDWNSDGRTETGVYRPGAGFYLKMDNGGTWNPTTDVYLGWDNAVNDLPVAGDWNSDGRTETGVYRPGAGFYLKMDAGNTWTPLNDVHLMWDNANGDLPLSGKFG